MKTIYLLPLLLIMAAGCASTSQQGYETPPPKANRVQVLMYDTTPRPKAQHFDVYGPSQPERPYKNIALLTCEGRVDQEVVMTQAIYYRARMLGAEGVIDAGNITTQKKSGEIYAGGFAAQAIAAGLGAGGSSARTVFRDYAIVYTDKSLLENTNLLNPADFTQPTSSPLPLENTNIVNSPRQR